MLRHITTRSLSYQYRSNTLTQNFNTTLLFSPLSLPLKPLQSPLKQLKQLNKLQKTIPISSTHRSMSSSKTTKKNKSISNVQAKKSSGMKGVKIDTPDEGSLTLSDTIVERYFVVGIHDCPRFLSTIEATKQLFLLHPAAAKKHTQVHFSSYQSIPYDTRRIEVLQSVGLPQHVHKGSPVSFACQTRITPPYIATNGIDRATFPTVFLGDNISFIAHLKQRLERPNQWSNAKELNDELKKNNFNLSFLYPPLLPRRQSTHWVDIVKAKHPFHIKVMPQRDNFHEYY